MSSSHEAIGENAGSFSAEERKEILARINELVSESSPPSAHALGKPRPAKRGLLLPLTVNILAIALIAGTYIFMQSRFADVQEKLDLSGLDTGSAGEAIIQGIREQSESLLEAKDLELEKARKTLSDIEQQARDLRVSMDDRIRARESELRGVIQKELETERGRLKNAGTSDAEIEKQLAAMEARKQNEFTGELRKLRQENEDTLKKKEAELSEARKAAEAIASRSSEDRLQLSRLSDIREREKLISDRIQTLSQALHTTVAAGDTAGFRAASAELKAYLASVSSAQAGFGTLPAITQRKDSELYLLDSLETLAASREKAERDLEAALRAVASKPEPEPAGIPAQISQASIPAAQPAPTVNPELEAEIRKLMNRNTELDRIISKTGAENRTLTDRIRDLSARLEKETLLAGVKDASIASLTQKVSALEAKVKDTEQKAYDRAASELQNQVLQFFKGERLLSGSSRKDDSFIANLAAAVARYIPSSGGKIEGASALRLVGTVSAVEGDVLKVESIGSAGIKNGEKITVRRKTPSGIEIVIAAGIVRDTQGSYITIGITEKLSGNSPLVMDPVYRAAGE